jgi:hypothetical protein
MKMYLDQQQSIWGKKNISLYPPTKESNKENGDFTLRSIKNGH